MKRQFIKGCEAIAEAAVRAGCKFFAGYPITPQNEIPEYLSKRLPEVDGIFVQGESEIASIYMVYGAACTGTRTMTSSAGIGISLKTEGISYLASARLPAVIVNVMRAGPGLGTILPAQGDYWQATKAPGHGGFKIMVLAPSTVQEAADLTVKAFDLADRDRNPVMLIADGVIGATMEPVILPEFQKNLPDTSSWRADGCKDRSPRLIANYNTEELPWPEFKKQRAYLYEKWQKEDVLVEEYEVADAEIVIAAYGTSARVAKTAIQQLRSEGIKAGLIRPITLVPFPYENFRRLGSHVKAILDVEMSIPGQMLEDVQLGAGQTPVKYLGVDGGIIVSPQDIIEKVQQIMAASGGN